MTEYNSAISSKQTGLDNFLQQLDSKLASLSSIKDRLNSKVDKIYGIRESNEYKTDKPLEEPVFIAPTQDSLGYKLDYLDVLITDITDTVEKLEDFI